MFEIMFNDLKPDAQKEFLKYMGLKDASEGNYEVVPIATIDYNDDNEDKGDEYGYYPDADDDEVVTSRSVDCPCDCTECEYADKCIENGRYDFSDDEEKGGE